MIRSLGVEPGEKGTLFLDAIVCCQNPTLNPAQLHSAVIRCLPEYAPDFCHIRREEIYDTNQTIFR